ncbi:type III PLP-dependent enzyme [Streptomyces zaomyceticus]|uniref:type III PLP-dependent enzyme n=1 Tax=Streptomyces zaomyceticus TaxID=68286 RepID=UPI003680950D
MDTETVRGSYRAFTEAFPGVLVHYAMKCNSDPLVLSTLVACGSGFELASLGELRLLTSLGLALDPDRLIHGSAVKPADHIRAMAQYGVRRFACDSTTELRRIATNAPGSSVYMRCAVDDSSSVFHMSNKFGAPLDEIVDLATQADRLGLCFEGLSFNVGSQASTEDSWFRAIQSLAGLFKRLASAGLPVRLLNLGGGYPVNSVDDSRPLLSAIAAAVRRGLDSLPYIPDDLIAEPGRALAARSTTLRTTVIARVPHGDVMWLFLDAGAYNALFEALRFQGSTRYRIEPEVPSTGPRARFHLAGPTGDGLDIIGEGVELPAGVAEGDRLIVRDAGAYTHAVASPFNGFPLPPILPARRGAGTEIQPALSEAVSYAL